MASPTLQLTSAASVTGWWLNQTVEIVDFGLRIGSRQKGWMTDEVRTALPGNQFQPSRGDGFYIQPFHGGFGCQPALAERFGSYAEYVIFTPGIAGSGPQRLIKTTDARGTQVLYYSPDCYQSFYELERVPHDRPGILSDRPWI